MFSRYKKLACLKEVQPFFLNFVLFCLQQTGFVLGLVCQRVFAECSCLADRVCGEFTEDNQRQDQED